MSDENNGNLAARGAFKAVVGTLATVAAIGLVGSATPMDHGNVISAGPIVVFPALVAMDGVIDVVAATVDRFSGNGPKGPTV